METVLVTGGAGSKQIKDFVFNFSLSTKEKCPSGILNLSTTCRTEYFSHPGAKILVDSSLKVSVPPLAKEVFA